MADRPITSVKPAYETSSGAAYCGDSIELLPELEDKSINLAITSPPFALQRKKEYDNKPQDEYVEWLLGFAEIVRDKLTEDGSLVLDLGGAYKKGVPSRSLYNFKVLIGLCEDLGFHLAEDFYWFNPSKLPGPIEWVNKRKIRAKDAVNTVWWLSKTEWPKADVSRVLTEYSERMKKLLENPEDFYRAKRRPSGHDISDRFGEQNAGAIPPNLLQIPNSESNGSYLKGCEYLGIKPHPARFPSKLPKFFIEMLTDPGDVVLDFFAGSNISGSVAETLQRKWISIEERREYVASSSLRFFGQNQWEDMRATYDQIVHSGDTIGISGRVDAPSHAAEKEELATQENLFKL